MERFSPLPGRSAAPRVVHTVYGVPELDADDKGKEELTSEQPFVDITSAMCALIRRAGDRNSAESLQLVRDFCAIHSHCSCAQDSLHSLLDELVHAPVVALAEGQPATVSVRVPGAQSWAAQMPDYSKAMDDEVTFAIAQ